MDSISIDGDSGLPKVNRSALPSAPRSEERSTQKNEDAGNLTDISALTGKVSSSSPDVRSEAVERGKALLADPNWPGDDVLDGLAEKLLDSGDLDS